MKPVESVPLTGPGATAYSNISPLHWQAVDAYRTLAPLATHEDYDPSAPITWREAFGAHGCPYYVGLRMSFTVDATSRRVDLRRYNEHMPPLAGTPRGDTSWLILISGHKTSRYPELDPEQTLSTLIGVPRSGPIAVWQTFMNHEVAAYPLSEGTALPSYLRQSAERNKAEILADTGRLLLDAAQVLPPQQQNHISGTPQRTPLLETELKALAEGRTTIF